MKTIKRIFLLAFSTLFFVNVHNVNAQVTIGGETEPVKGTTLDLSPSGGYVGGFKLPNVSLDDLISIPDAFDDKSSGMIVATDLVGTMVYNTNSTIGTGVYLWNGSKWQAMFSAGASSSLDNIYPVGSIYMSVSSTDPSTILGGTWEAWGAGRVPVGVDSSDTDFAENTVGGEKTNTHQHFLPFGTDSKHFYMTPYIREGLDSRVWLGDHYSSIHETIVNGPIREVTSYNATINNLQPYITCYMWKRTN